MGDSYSAGNGARGYYGSDECYRSSRNYARQYERKVEQAPYNQRAFVENAACSGATTDAFFTTFNGHRPQIDELPDGNEYDVIFLTIGGNDLNFGDIVQYCLVAISRDGANCGGLLSQAERMLVDGTLKAKVATVLRSVRRRAHPYANIVLLGYPYLEGDATYRLRSGHFGNTFIDAGKRIRKIGDDGDRIQQQVVNELNAANPGLGTSVFIKTKDLFAGKDRVAGPPNHELFAQKNNDDRWFVQPRIDAALGETSVWYHPNPEGWDQEAGLLVRDARVPKHDATKPPPGPPPPPPPPPLGFAVAVAAGSNETCALLAGGGVSCWGLYGPYSGTPVIVTGITDATQVTVGAGHKCALRAGGTVSCWGWNDHGQLGNGSTTEYSATPVSVTGINNATQVAANGTSPCALHSGTISCWGANQRTPVARAGFSNVTRFSLGGPGLCALQQGGTIICQGRNDFGQLGNGSTTPSATPVSVTGINNATQITGGNNHTCALLASGSVVCWGLNAWGQLGGSLTTNYSPTPVQVTGINDATQITAGGQHACVRVATGAISCWGRNDDGQVGSQYEPAWNRPVGVYSYPNSFTAAQVTAGSAHTCALRTIGGTISCWGDDLVPVECGCASLSWVPKRVIGFP